MPAKNPRVSVPKAAGEEITLRVGGDDPVTYKVEGGQVAVPPEHVAAVLAGVDGSSVVGGSTAASAEKE